MGKREIGSLSGLLNAEEPHKQKVNADKILSQSLIKPDELEELIKRLRPKKDRSINYKWGRYFFVWILYQVNRNLETDEHWQTVSLSELKAFLAANGKSEEHKRIIDFCRFLNNCRFFNEIFPDLPQNKELLKLYIPEREAQGFIINEELRVKLIETITKTRVKILETQTRPPASLQTSTYALPKALAADSPASGVKLAYAEPEEGSILTISLSEKQIWETEQQIQSSKQRIAEALGEIIDTTNLKSFSLHPVPAKESFIEDESFDLAYAVLLFKEAYADPCGISLKKSIAFSGKVEENGVIHPGMEFRQKVEACKRNGIHELIGRFKLSAEEKDWLKDLGERSLDELTQFDNPLGVQFFQVETLTDAIGKAFADPLKEYLNLTICEEKFQKWRSEAFCEITIDGNPYPQKDRLEKKCSQNMKPQVRFFVGSGGAGKTTYFSREVYRLADDRLDKGSFLMPAGIYVDISDHTTKGDIIKRILEAVNPGGLMPPNEDLQNYVSPEIRKCRLIPHIDGLERLPRDLLETFLKDLVKQLKNIRGIWHLAVRDEVFKQLIRDLFEEECDNEILSPEISEASLEGLTPPGRRKMISISNLLKEKQIDNLTGKLESIPDEISRLPFFMDAVIKSYAENEFDEEPTRRSLLRRIISRQLVSKKPILRELLYSLALFCLQKNSMYFNIREFYQHLEETWVKKAFPELSDLAYSKLKDALFELEKKRFIVPIQLDKTYRFYYDLILEHLAAECLLEYKLWDNIKDEKHLVRFPWIEALKECTLLAMDRNKWTLCREIVNKLALSDAAETLSQMEHKKFEPDKKVLREKAFNSLKSGKKMLDSARALEILDSEEDIRRLILEEEIEYHIKDYLLILAADHSYFTFLKVFLEEPAMKSAALQLIYEAPYKNLRADLVESLVSMLEDKRLRDITLNILFKIDAERTTEYLLPLLNHEDADIIRFALDGLGRTRIKNNAEHIIPLIEHEDKYVRFEAIYNIKELRYKEALPHIVPRLKDEQEDKLTRRMAILAIGELGGEQELEHIIPLLKHEDKVSIKSTAEIALGQIGAKNIEKNLVPLLENEDAEIRAAAVNALKFARDQDATDYFIEMLKDKDAGVRDEAVTGIRISKDDNAKFCVIPLLSHKDAGVRVGALEVLFGIKDKDLTDNIIPLLKDKDTKVRAAAATALKYITDKNTASLIIALLDDENAEVRNAAAFAVLAIEVESVIPCIIRLLKYESMPLKFEAISKCKKMLGKKAIKYIEPLLKDKDSDIRCKAIWTIAELGGKNAAKNIKSMLNDNNKDVKAVALKALEKNIGKKSLKHAAEMLQDYNAVVRIEAVRVLGNIGSKNALKLVIQMLKDFDEGVRMEAVAALGKIGSRKALTNIIKMFNDIYVSVRITAINTSVKFDDKIVVESVIQMLKDLDAKVRKEAESGLFRISEKKEFEPFRSYFNPDQPNKKEGIRLFIRTYRTGEKIEKSILDFFIEEMKKDRKYWAGHIRIRQDRDRDLHIESKLLLTKLLNIIEDY